MFASVHRSVARVARSWGFRMSGLTLAVTLIAVGQPGERAEACETQEWDGGKMTKWVNADVENNKLTITVEYTKKNSEAGKSIRFVEMIGPSNVIYFDRVLVGGGHKKIPAGDASGKVTWTVTKSDIPNLRRGAIGGCASCHDESNMPALQEWPNDPDFEPLTDQDFKNWIQGMKDNGYEQYIDVNAQDPGDENTDIKFKTRCFQTPKRCDSGLPSDFNFFHFNRGPSGFYTLEFDNVQIPPGWEIFSWPSIGSPYFLSENQGLYCWVTILPHGVVSQGDQARVTICATDQDTGECPETFNLRAVKDDLPPMVVDGPSAWLDCLAPMGRLAAYHPVMILVGITVSDQPATVASAKLFYSLNGGLERSDFMDVVSSGTDPVELEQAVGPVRAGVNTLDYYVRVTDELGNQMDTPPQSGWFLVPDCDASVTAFDSSPPNADVLTAAPMILGAPWRAEVTHAAGTAVFSALLLRGERVPGDGAPAGTRGRLLVTGSFLANLAGTPDELAPILASQRNFRATIPADLSLACLGWFAQAITGGAHEQRLSNGVEGVIGMR